MMNHFEQEYTDYKKFIFENYPNSVFNKDILSLKKPITHIFKCIKFLELLIDEETNRTRKTLLEDLHTLFFKMLYVLPINDNYFVSLTFRGISESMLRFFMFEQNNNLSITELRNEQYRFLWQKVKRAETYLKLKNSVNQINCIFGDNSKIIHNTKPNIKGITYLYELTEGSSKMKPRRTFNTLLVLADTTIDSLFFICKVDFDDLSTSNKRMFKEILH